MEFVDRSNTRHVCNRASSKLPAEQRTIRGSQRSRVNVGHAHKQPASQPPTVTIATCHVQFAVHNSHILQNNENFYNTVPHSMAVTNFTTQCHILWHSDKFYNTVPHFMAVTNFTTQCHILWHSNKFYNTVPHSMAVKNFTTQCHIPWQ